MQAEQMLACQRPVIDDVDLDVEIQPPPEYQARIAMLDGSIQQLRAELTEAKTVVQRSLVKYTEFERHAAEFFQKQELNAKT
jgi:C4-type Zn-finger protein